jgi:hypothetical protein
MIVKRFLSVLALTLGAGLPAVSQQSVSQPSPAEKTSAAARAEVLVLGTYHMANPGHDIYNMQADDVLAPKRQQELAELAAVLKKFHPTKIAVEADYGTDAVPKRYAEYLAGTHPLSRNEIEQIGFRLAKDLGHMTIYPVDADGDFPWPRIVNYAKANGQSAKLEEISGGGWGAMVKAQGEYLKTHTVLETLLYMNSDARVAKDVGFYYLVARFGEPGDYAGPDLLTEWYRRNIRIYNNVLKLDSIHPQILHHLSVVIECVGHGKCRQVQAYRFGARRGLQHVLGRQRSRGLVTQGKRVLQEFDDLGLGLHALRTIPSLVVLRDLVAGHRRPQVIVGSGDMPDLQRERAHALVVGARNAQALGREVEFLFRHGLRSVHDQLFDVADGAVDG